MVVGGGGPSHFFLKYAENFDGGSHHHTSDHGGYVLSGTVLLTVDGKKTRIDVRGMWDAIPDCASTGPGK